MNGNKDARKKLIDSLKRAGHLKSENVIRAFDKVDRKCFVLKEHEKIAYADYPLPIPGNATISAPHMHAIVLELLDLKENDDVLEIGFGSGILLAYINEIATNGRIVGAEIKKETYRFGKNNLERCGYTNLKLIDANVIKYSANLGKFDKIVVSASAKNIPDKLVGLLKTNGKIIIPVGEYFQELFLVENKGKKIIKRSVGGVVFVPLVY